MKKYVNKLTLSIALVVLSLLTMVATTYAWVGLLTGTTFDEFTINLQPSNEEISDYGIQFSLDGIHFSDNINQEELRRYLLHNIDPLDKYKDYLTKNSRGEYIVNDNRVNDEFRKLRVDQCTTERPENPNDSYDRISFFTDLYGNKTKNYLNFELYISIYKVDADGTTTDSEKELDLYLRGDKLITAKTSSTGIYTTRLFNPVTYPTNPGLLFGKQILGDPSVNNAILPGTEISGNVSIDIATACRVSLSKFVTVDKGHPEQYDNVDKYATNGLFIFQNDDIYPTYNSSTGVYNFGGVLPDEYNFARQYYNTIHKEAPLGSVPETVINRGDKVFADDGIVNRLVTNNIDHVTTAKMIGFRICFWFEGWDSNCFEVIDNKEISVNLTFSTKSPNED